MLKESVQNSTHCRAVPPKKPVANDGTARQRDPPTGDTSTGDTGEYGFGSAFTACVGASNRRTAGLTGDERTGNHSPKAFSSPPRPTHGSSYCTVRARRHGPDYAAFAPLHRVVISGDAARSTSSSFFPSRKKKVETLIVRPFLSSRRRNVRSLRPLPLMNSADLI